jgi:hypothetical protein
MTVDGGQAYSTVVHLSCEYLIAKEVVTEYTAITVRAENALMSSDIREVSDHGMHAVVLLLYIVQMLGMSVDRVAAKDSLH